jgi:hypothetical protein
MTPVMMLGEKLHGYFVNVMIAGTPYKAPSSIK